MAKIFISELRLYIRANLYILPWDILLFGAAKKQKMTKSYL